MATRDAVRLYSESDLQNARTRGQIVGWLQGGVGVGAALIVVSLIGWIPMLVVAAVVGFVVYKLFRR